MRSIAVVGAVVLVAMCVGSGVAFCKSPTPAHPKNQRPKTTGKVQANGNAKAQSSASGGCGASDPTSALNLTPSQKKKLEEIETARTRKMQNVQVDVDALDREISKLVDDPKASDAQISNAVQKLANAQAKGYMVGIMAERESNKVYTAAQRAILAKSANCGCGSGGSGGCGSGSGSGCGSSCGSSAGQPAAGASNK
jgi:Spy/CpxP family protein refolding chaperone